MRFSIVVPMYNSERTIEKCLISLINQDYDDFEIILVNDGSGDRTIEIVNSIIVEHSNIKIINQQNMGHTAARSNGLNATKGDYVLFVDSDDWCEADMLTSCDNAIKEHNPDIVMFSHKECTGDGHTEKSLEAVKGLHRLNQDDVFSEKLIMDRNGKSVPRALWGKAFRKALVEKWLHKVPQEIITGEDMCCFLASALESESIYVSNSPLYCYRITEGSISRKGDSKAIERCRYTVGFLNSLTADREEYLTKQLYRLIVLQMYSAIQRELWSGKKANEIKASLKILLDMDIARKAIKEAHFSRTNKDCLIKKQIVKHRLIRTASLLNKSRSK